MPGAIYFCPAGRLACPRRAQSILGSVRIAFETDRHGRLHAELAAAAGGRPRRGISYSPIPILRQRPLLRVCDHSMRPRIKFLCSEMNCVADFRLLVLKGIYHCWTDFLIVQLEGFVPWSFV